MAAQAQEGVRPEADLLLCCAPLCHLRASEPLVSRSDPRKARPINLLVAEGYDRASPPFVLKIALVRMTEEVKRA